jgi:DNA-binding transcriptional regulator YiaG
VAEIEGFRQALAMADLEKPSKRSTATRGSYELREYDQLKTDELELLHIKRLDGIGPFVSKIRIAKGASQTELARRLGVSNAGHRNPGWSRGS